MRTTLRAVIALVLVATVLLVKVHLDSLSQWQDSGDRRTSARDSYVLEDGDAYIELVSAEPTTTTTNPTRRKWIPTARPTPRSMAASAQHKRIPVDVPGAEWSWGGPWYQPSKTNRLSNSQKLHAQQLGPIKQLQEANIKKLPPSSSAPPRPKITPKSDRTIILGKMSYEDTNWLEDELPEYARSIPNNAQPLTSPAGGNTQYTQLTTRKHDSQSNKTKAKKATSIYSTSWTTMTNYLNTWYSCTPINTARMSNSGNRTMS